MALKNAMIIIAVSKYKGDLGDLPGALVSARALKKWAEKPGEHQSYNVLEITDEGQNQTVTVNRVISEVTDFLDNNIIDRLVVYFAGHGVMGTLPNQYWLLTEAANNTREGIDVEAFRRGLANVGIGQHNRKLKAGQLILIGDACRNVGALAANFRGDGIYTKTASASQKRLHQDRYFSTLAGNISLHVNARNGQDPYCLFSKIIVEVLEGEINGVFTDQSDGSSILENHEFADCLDDELPKRSQGICQAQVFADTYTNIRPKYHIYASQAAPAVPPGGSSDTTPAAVTAMGSVNTTISIDDLDLPTFKSPSRSGFLSPPEDADDAIIVSDIPIRRLWGPRAHQMQLRETDGQHAVVCEQSAGGPVVIETEESILLAPIFPNTRSVITGGYPDDIFLLRLDGSRKVDTILGGLYNREHGRSLKMRDAAQLADDVRRRKHSFPHQAVAAAYLYELAGDYDNVARTAHYMARDGLNAAFVEDLERIEHPYAHCFVPFDLALLCAETIGWDRTGRGFRAFADLPSVDPEESENWRPGQGRPGYALAGFQQRLHIPVWGVCPVFRQGWSFMQTANHLKFPPGMLAVAEAVQGASATRLGENVLEAFLNGFDYVEYA